MHLLALLLLLSSPGPDVRATAVEVLNEWDSARTTAYAAGNREGLADLYVAGEGAADLRIFDDYRSRGLTVWQRTQVFSTTVREVSPRHLELGVTDRTLTVIGDGRRCRALPTTRPVAREITFERSGAGWRVVEVRAAPPATPR